MLSRIAANAKTLAAVYSKYDLDTKAAEALIGKIHRDQVTLTRLHHKQQQIRRSQLTQDQFDKSQKTAPPRPRESAPDF